ncbi:hypothetical protein F4802DRAFT_117150 [Xylaria palmicola]|nr:hypothetical protein F4802DRAFT_117150 [Xylaria palmicola]
MAPSLSSISRHMRDAREQDLLSPTGPPPSLWPEPTSPIPVTRRPVQPSTASEMPNPPARARVIAERRLASANANTSSAVSSAASGAASGAASAADSVANPAVSGVTFPSSTATSTAPPFPSRRIETDIPHAFKPQYPGWFSYPPVQPPLRPSRLDTLRPPMPVTVDSFDPTDLFLQQSRAFQTWVQQMNAERIRLRHTPEYEDLLMKLRQCQLLADRGATPALRTDAKQHIIAIKEKQAEERKRISAAELQYIREIELAWVSFVSLEKYEQEAARRRSLAAGPELPPREKKSMVAALLGAEGSGDSEIEQPSGLLAGGPAYPIPVPEWFPVVEAQGKLGPIKGETIEERYKNLLNKIHELESNRYQEEYLKAHPDEGWRAKNNNWDKNWHEPNPGWPHEGQRIIGGWWKCRTGPTATEMENNCACCKTSKSRAELEGISDEPPAQQLARVMAHIQTAMAVVAEEDKRIVLERLASDEDELARPKQEKPWLQFGEDAAPARPGTSAPGPHSRQQRINYAPLRGLEDPASASEEGDMGPITLGSLGRGDDDDDDAATVASSGDSKGKGKGRESYRSPA